ncbi:MAG: hypothetical protein JWM88_583 [Verrucomicrobia bacterium]|nr:hypothetical protein [Verrucomicrobiota bacterium]
MFMEPSPPDPSAVASRPRRIRGLREIQRLMHASLLRPLAAGDRMQRKWTDGRPMAEVAAEIIKPNDRLTAFDRLEIYNRMYWFRLVDCFHDDNPGLRAMLGARKFDRLALAYLAKRPSRSFTLRNLCSGLEAFLRAEPAWTAPRTALAIDIARFEWAQTVAFDEEAFAPVTAADLGASPPSRLRLAVQPYVQLLALNHPVDAYVIAVKKRDTLRAEASNATTAARRRAAVRRIRLPRRSKTWIAVHRVENQLYYKRLESSAFRILEALRAGARLSRALARGGAGVTTGQVRDWFALWTELGWLCRRK